MRYILTASIAFAMAHAFAAPQPPPYTRQSLKTAMSTASTPADCNRLASYFEDRALHYKQLSEEQRNATLQQSEHSITGLKFPTAIDRARRLQEYYLQQSRQAHHQSERFKSLANTAAASQ